MPNSLPSTDLVPRCTSLKGTSRSIPRLTINNNRSWQHDRIVNATQDARKRGIDLRFTAVPSRPLDGAFSSFKGETYFSRESKGRKSYVLVTMIITISRVPSRCKDDDPRNARATAEFSLNRLHSYVRRFNAVGHPLATTGTRDCRPSCDPRRVAVVADVPTFRRHTSARFSLRTCTRWLPCAAVVIYAAIPITYLSTFDFRPPLIRSV